MKKSVSNRDRRVRDKLGSIKKISRQDIDVLLDTGLILTPMYYDKKDYNKLKPVFKYKKELYIPEDSRLKLDNDYWGSLRTYSFLTGSKNDLFVIDLDNIEIHKNDSDKICGVKYFRELSKYFGYDLEDLASVKTAGDGYHLYFRYDDGGNLDLSIFNNKTNFSFNENGKTPLVDIRTNDGLIIGPGSIRNDKKYGGGYKKYEFVDKSMTYKKFNDSIEEIPYWLYLYLMTTKVLQHYNRCKDMTPTIYNKILEAIKLEDDRMMNNYYDSLYYDKSLENYIGILRNLVKRPIIDVKSVIYDDNSKSEFYNKIREIDIPKDYYVEAVNSLNQERSDNYDDFWKVISYLSLISDETGADYYDLALSFAERSYKYDEPSYNYITDKFANPKGDYEIAVMALNNLVKKDNGFDFWRNLMKKYKLWVDNYNPLYKLPDVDEHKCYIDFDGIRNHGINRNNIELYEDEYVREYDFHGANTLCIKSSMSTGKTRGLLKYLDRSNYECIIFVSHRISFTNQSIQMLEKYGFIPYLDIEDTFIDLNKYPRIIIQVESLWKISGPRIPDLLICDELKTCEESLFSNLSPNPKGTIEQYERLFRDSKKIIVMDAHIDQHSIDFITSLNDPIDETKPARTLYFQWNKVKKDINFTYEFIINNKYAMWYLFELIKSNKKIVIYTTESADNTLALYYKFQELFPKLSIGLYTSKSDDDTFQRDLKNVNKYWKKHNVILLSPSVMCGINMYKRHFDLAYCILSTNSITCKNTMQLMRRVRNLKDNKYYIHVKYHKHDKLPTNEDDIVEQIDSNLRKILSSILDSLDVFNKPVYKNRFWKLFISQKKYKNLSANNFTFRLASMIKSTGSKIILHEYTADFNNINYIITKDDLKKLKENEYKQIADAKVDKEHEMIIEYSIKNRTNKHIDRFIKIKYYLHVNFNLDYELITPEIVKSCYPYLKQTSHLRKMLTDDYYFNKNYIHNWLNIIDNNNKLNDYIKELISFDYNYKDYQKHKYINDIIKKLCGFQHLFTKELIHANDLKNNISNWVNSLTQDDLNHVKYIFNNCNSTKLKYLKNNNKYFANVIQFINGKLKLIGCKLIKIKDKYYGIKHFVAGSVIYISNDIYFNKNKYINEPFELIL